jgi:hypothetical protein
MTIASRGYLGFSPRRPNRPIGLLSIRRERLKMSVASMTTARPC